MLTAEPAILTRLAAQIAAMSPPMSPAPRACSSATIAGSLDVAALCPLVVVHPARAEKIERGSDDLLTEHQIWKVVVVVKNVPNITQLTVNYQAVSLLLETLVRALEGWAPAEAFNAMRYVGRLETEVGQGFTEFPIEFQTRFALSTVPSAPSADDFLTADVQYDIAPTTTGEPVAEDEIPLPQ